jgi:hypothetical protein
MKQPLTTHEFAQILLATENKPLFIQENYDVCGESNTGYSTVKGVVEGIVEEGLILDVNYLAANVNDKRYQKGDAIVSMAEADVKLNVGLDNMLYMLLSKGDHYHSWDVDRIAFFEKTDEPDVSILKPTIMVSIGEGFQTEWQQMTLDEAQSWYKEMFSDRIEENDQW